MSTKTLLQISAAAVLLFAAGAANATSVTTTSASTFATLGNNASQGSVADSVNWSLFATALGTPQNNGSIATNDTTKTPGSDSVKVTSGDGQGFVTYAEGQGTSPTNGVRSHTDGTAWDGLFNNGAVILASTANTITLSFSTPLIGLGIDAQMFLAGNYSETLTAFNASGAQVGTVTNNGISQGATSGDKTKEGTVPFVGISTDAQNNDSSLATAGISYVTISVACTTSPSCSTGGFAIDTSLLYHYPISNTASGATTTPEPGTLGLLGAGLAGLGLVRRRRNQA